MHRTGREVLWVSTEEVGGEVENILLTGSPQACNDGALPNVGRGRFEILVNVGLGLITP